MSCRGRARCRCWRTAVVLTDDRRAAVGDVRNMLAEGIGQHVVAVAQEARGDIGIASRIVGVIAVGHRLSVVAKVHHVRQLQRRCEVVCGIERYHVEVIDVVLWTGEDVFGTDRQRLHRRRTLTEKAVVAARIAQIRGNGVSMEAQIQIVLPDPILREMTPAAFLEGVDRRIGAEGAVVDTVLGLSLALIERAAGYRGVESLIGEAVLHRHCRGAAQSIQPEHRCRAQYVDPVDGDIRNEVPIDRVAESLVDTHAVLVDRHALRRTEHRRRLEATKQQVGLEGVRERIVEIDGADLLIECAEHVGGTVAGQVACS